MVRWDSVAQGLALLFVSYGFYKGLYWLFFLDIVEDYVESSCQVTDFTFFEHDADYVDSAGLKPPHYNSFRISVVYSDSSGKGEGIIVLPAENCFDSTECAYKLGFYESQKLRCFHNERTNEMHLDLSHLEYPTDRVILFVVIVVCMCLPCCFIGGLLLLLIGIFNLHSTILSHLRCDNTLYDHKKTDDMEVLLRTSSVEGNKTA